MHFSNAYLWDDYYHLQSYNSNICSPTKYSMHLFEFINLSISLPFSLFTNLLTDSLFSYAIRNSLFTIICTKNMINSIFCKNILRHWHMRRLYTIRLLLMVYIYLLILSSTSQWQYKSCDKSLTYMG